MTFLDPDADEACTLALNLRMRGGLTQAALASATGLSVSTIRRYENGQRTPSRKTLERLAAGAGVSLAEIERDLAQERRTLFASEPRSSDISQEEASEMIANTMRRSSLRIIQSKLGIDLSGILPPAPARRKSESMGGWDRPVAAPAVEVKPWLMMRKAITLHAMGNDRKAAEELSLASLMISGVSSSGPLFVFYMMRSAFLVAAGELEAAQDLLSSLEDISQRLPPPGESLRLRWLTARVAGALGRRERASATLRTLQAELTDLEMPLETLCVWADRVALELERENLQPGEASARSEEPSWVLDDRGLHGSMVEGLATFRSLLASGEATPSIARRFVAFLLSAHVDPGIPFDPQPKPEKDDDELGEF